MIHNRRTVPCHARNRDHGADHRRRVHATPTDARIRRASDTVKH